MGIGERLGNALRALRGHAQPCQTCRNEASRLRSEILDLQTWAVEWDQRLGELLEKQRAQWARMRGRDHKLREELVERVKTEILSHDGAADHDGAAGQGVEMMNPEERKRALRRRAVERGMIG